jgi:lipoprotein-anchoring transpeptidase ErfK/SrfK
MRFQWSDHSFDVQSAFFVGRLLCLFVFGLLVLQFSSSYAHVYSDSTAPDTPIPTTAIATTTATVADTQSDINPLPLRVIRNLTIQDVIPKEGKFIAADLVAMQVSLYQDEKLVTQYPIKTKGRPGTPWETPAGLYKIQTKEESHFSSIGKVYMPYSMQFYGNYFIHGWTYYPDGTPTPFTFSGGCIKLDTADAKKVFEFAEVGTPVFVYDPKEPDTLSTLTLSSVPVPQMNSDSWLVADVDTGDVYAEHNADAPEDPSSASTLMIALVANETISLDKKVSVPEGALTQPPDDANSTAKTFLVDDLFYPLLLEEPNTPIVDALATFNGRRNFVRSMNSTAFALDMASTTFVSTDSASPENSTTAEDLYRLAWYLTNKKSFVWEIATTDKKTIKSLDGTKYVISRSTASSTVSVATFQVGDVTRHIAVITLGPLNQVSDNQVLSNWIAHSARSGSQAACASCTVPHYRKIDI